MNDSARFVEPSIGLGVDARDDAELLRFQRLGDPLDRLLEPHGQFDDVGEIVERRCGLLGIGRRARGHEKRGQEQKTGSLHR